MGRILQIAWDRWQIIGKINGDYIARGATTVFYFTILVPFALGVRWFSDPLDLRGKAAWKTRKPVGATIDDAREQA